ncbi:TerB N-terminal domain-containing protein [Halomicronema sp. CCY15110]|uniref:tellurite resistance TerB family protein n=1 Tax=Halomicronema sp. CCY15110 TaxID=2767773 RepID=UPI00194F317F|nr:TerB N-terminal domain-containing protein [Halomicronema sp. CCY15110]
MLNWLKRLFQGNSNPSSRNSSVSVKLSSKASPQTDCIRSPLPSTRPRTPPQSPAPVPPKSKTRVPSPPPTPTALWVPPGKSVKVKDYVIPGGMVYVGTRLQTEGPHPRVDPCLINPQLRIAASQPDYEGSGMGYWPSYSDIRPDCRAAYLEWLSGDRCAPDACIGYVFLFFYGLERRVLRDFQALKIDVSEELAQITAEVERLLEIYRSNGSFSSYGSRFLEICQLLQNFGNWADVEPPLTRTGWEMPLGLKVTLGRMIAEGQPIPADWMWSWYLHSEQTRLRTPATRCADEFRKLLRSRYQQHYGAGMVIKPNKRKLKLEYRPASSGFLSVNLTHLQGNLGDLPDISGLSAPLNKLQTLIDECTDALDPYSRWLGRNGESTDPKAALALLPPELVDDLEDPHIRKLEQWLAQTLGENEQVVVPSQQLLEKWSASSTGNLTKKESTTLAKAIENLGYGIEPDVRFGGKPLKSDHSIVLFKLPGEITAAPSKEYTAAMLLLHLAATVASSDAAIDAAEQQVLEAHLESALHLSKAERTRLRAHLTWLLQAKLSLQGLKAKLNQMTTDERAGIADFLISVAGADGYISPQEITMLTKIYPLLGFEADEVYSHIHTFNTASPVTPATAPVTVRSAAQTVSGFAIPAPPEVEEDSPEKSEAQDGFGFNLDLAAIQHKQAESAKVADLLGNLFEEDEPEAEAPEPAYAAESEAAIAGLDALHSQLLLAIAQQTTWHREALEAKADELGLLLDGALEVINEVAFDACDDPLTDGEDLIEIDTDVLEQLLS